MGVGDIRPESGCARMERRRQVDAVQHGNRHPHAGPYGGLGRDFGCGLPPGGQRPPPGSPRVASARATKVQVEVADVGLGDDTAGCYIR